MVGYWSAYNILKQTAAELGLPIPASFLTDTATGSVQLVALLNAAGNELLEYYPWQNLLKEWDFTTVVDQGEYELPDDWAYFLDQTQWDRTDHWPLLGPKSPQEWAWLKGGLLAAAPRMRYRVMENNFLLWPVPGADSGPATFNIAMEYVGNGWVKHAGDPDPTYDGMVTDDADEVLYNPWMVNKYIKLKFYQLKGFDTTGVQSDFMRIFTSLTGKDKGAPRLSLAPMYPPLFIGPWSIPDGSWDTANVP